MRTGIFGNDDEILQVTTSICRLDDQIKCGDSGHDLEIFVFLDSRQEVFDTHRTIKKEIFDVSLMELCQLAKIVSFRIEEGHCQSDVDRVFISEGDDRHSDDDSGL